MELLRRRGTPFHAPAVVTSASFERADDLFKFFTTQAVAEVGSNFDVGRRPTR
jgi:hypothetical protein